MIIARRYIGVVLLGALVCGVPTYAALAQTADSTNSRLVGFEADSLVVRTVNGVEIHELQNARLREGTTEVRADRLVDRGGGIYNFYDRVVIIDESDTLTADRVLYNRRLKTGNATGNVRFGDGEVVVTAPEGDYDVRAKRADFRAGVTLRDSALVLSSRAGTWWSDENRAEFSGDVILAGDSVRVAADSVAWWRPEQRSVARGSVILERSRYERDAIDSLETSPRLAERTWVITDRAESNEADDSYKAIGNVLLMRVSYRPDTTGRDTLWIAARKLQSMREDSLEVLSVTDSVRIRQADFAAVADSVSTRRIRGFGAVRNQSRLFGAPMAWFRRVQISGDTVRVVGRGDAIDSLFVAGRAFVARKDSASERLQQIKGQYLVGLFRGDSLRSLRVWPNAEALYWLQRGDDEGISGVRTSADQIRFRFSGDDVAGIQIVGSVEGTYWPEGLEPGPADLDGLQWKPEASPRIAGFLQRFRIAFCRLDPGLCPRTLSLPTPPDGAP